MRRRIKVEYCKRCGVRLSPSGACPGINCPTRKEERDKEKKKGEIYELK